MAKSYWVWLTLAAVLVLADHLSAAGQESGISNIAYSESLTIEDEEVSLHGTRLISAGATAGSVFLIGIPAVGPFVALGVMAHAPSYGSYRVGDRERFNRGFLTRTAILVGGGLGILGSVLYCFDRGCNYQEPVATVVSLAYVAHALYDIFFLSSRAVREYNEQISETAQNVSVSPWMHPGTESAGMSLSIRF